VELGLLFLVLSGVFTFGWMMGSGIGYQNGRRDAEDPEGDHAAQLYQTSRQETGDRSQELPSNQPS